MFKFFSHQTIVKLRSLFYQLLYDSDVILVVRELEILFNLLQVLEDILNLAEELYCFLLLHEFDDAEGELTDFFHDID